MKGLPSNLVIASASAIEFDADGAPKRRIKLLPMGSIAMRDGRGPFLLRDRAHAEAVVAATADWLASADLMGDYDHQALYAAQPGVGGTAIASGWVKPADLHVEDDGIYADVTWTEAAAAKLSSREYRYVSPTFVVDTAKSVLRFKNFALVNIPAIDLPAIAAGFSEPPERENMTKAIAEALGLSGDSAEVTILASIAALKTSTSTAAIAAAAGLATTATVEEIAASVTTLKAGAVDLADYVPKSIVEPLQAEVKRIRTDRLTSQVDTLVAAGVVMPAKRQVTLDWFEKDEVAAAAFFKDMPSLVTPGAKEAAQREPVSALTEDEKQVAASLGVSEADFLKTRNEELVH